MLREKKKTNDYGVEVRYRYDLNTLIPLRYSEPKYFSDEVMKREIEARNQAIAGKIDSGNRTLNDDFIAARAAQVSADLDDWYQENVFRIKANCSKHKADLETIDQTIERNKVILSELERQKKDLEEKIAAYQERKNHKLFHRYKSTEDGDGETAST